MLPSCRRRCVDLGRRRTGGVISGRGSQRPLVSLAAASGPASIRARLLSCRCVCRHHKCRQCIIMPSCRRHAVVTRGPGTIISCRRCAAVDRCAVVPACHHSIVPPVCRRRAAVPPRRAALLCRDRHRYSCTPFFTSLGSHSRAHVAIQQSLKDLWYITLRGMFAGRCVGAVVPLPHTSYLSWRRHHMPASSCRCAVVT